MSALQRLGIGACLLALWFGLLGPQLSHSLLEKRATRPGTITLSTLQMALKQLHHSGGTQDLESAYLLHLNQEIAAIKQMTMHEEQIVAAIWALVPSELEPDALAAAQTQQEPTTQFSQHYIDPHTPELIQAVMESYGYRRLSASLPDRPASPSKVSARIRLRATSSLVRDKALTDDTAALILDATLRLSRAQQTRVDREHALTAQLPDSLREIAIRVQQPKVQLNH